MFTTIIEGKKIEILLKNKLSFSSFLTNIEVLIEGVVHSLTEDDFLLDVFDLHDEKQMIVNGNFKLSNGMDFSFADTIELQKKYLEWEEAILTKQTVMYRVPTGREDKLAGIPKHNPYFLAAMNHVAHNFVNFSSERLGVFYSAKELNFSQQYFAFHPELHRYISMKHGNCLAGAVYEIPLNIVLFMGLNAASHIEGHRDSSRYAEVYKQNKITPQADSKIDSLLDFDHVLDGGIIEESINFRDGYGSGGLLDFRNSPF